MFNSNIRSQRLVSGILCATLLLITSCKKDGTVVTREQDQQDATQPTVAIVRPVAGSIRSQIDTVLVQASDNVGVTKVELYVNGGLALTDVNAPWEFLWNTLSVADGLNRLSAKAYDAAGNVGTSTEISVTVRNLNSVVGLASATPYTSSVLPGKYSYNQQTNYWSVVGLRPPTTADYDLVLFNDSTYTTKLDSSVEDVGKVDFVVGDYNHNPLGVYYPKAVMYSGTGSYAIEWEDGSEQLSVPGTSPAVSWGNTNIVKVWDANLTGGTRYTITLNVVSGSADFGIAMFKSNETTYYGKRGGGGAAALADAFGNGQGESFVYTPSATDWHGIVVWSNNAASATFTIQVAQ